MSGDFVVRLDAIVIWLFSLLKDEQPIYSSFFSRLPLDTPKLRFAGAHKNLSRFLCTPRMGVSLKVRVLYGMNHPLS
jgi:hypothetical protein